MIPKGSPDFPSCAHHVSAVHVNTLNSNTVVVLCRDETSCEAPQIQRCMHGQILSFKFGDSWTKTFISTVWVNTENVQYNNACLNRYFKLSFLHVVLRPEAPFIYIYFTTETLSFFFLQKGGCFVWSAAKSSALFCVRSLFSFSSVSPAFHSNAFMKRWIVTLVI